MSLCTESIQMGKSVFCCMRQEDHKGSHCESGTLNHKLYTLYWANTRQARVEGVSSVTHCDNDQPAYGGVI